MLFSVFLSRVIGDERWHIRFKSLSFLMRSP